MSDNALFAVIFATCVASCTSCQVAEKLKPETAQTVCVRNAFTTADRIACMQAAKP